MLPSSSYQHGSDRPSTLLALSMRKPEETSRRHLIWFAGLVIVVASGIFVRSLAVNTNANDPTMDQAGGIWGSSKHSSRKKTKHHTPVLKASPNMLLLEGYPSLQVRQQYLDDLAKIDWNQVEEDIEDLLTDSQDCK